MKKPSFAESYMGRLRAKVGTDLVLVPAVRAVVLNAAGEILMIKRSDDGKWALPSGLPEVGEAASDAIQREVFEETGVELGDFACFGISSEAAAEVHTYPNGDQVHAYAILFYSHDFKGQPGLHDDEVLAVRWYPTDRLPAETETSKPDQATLRLFAEFRRTGQFQIK